MKKIIISTIALMTVITPVLAHGRSFGHRPYYGYSYGHYGHRHNNYGAWVAGAIGLGVLGAIIYDQYGRRCVNRVVGYDQLGNPIIQPICD